MSKPSIVIKKQTNNKETPEIQDNSQKYIYKTIEELKMLSEKEFYEYIDEAKRYYENPTPFNFLEFIEKANFEFKNDPNKEKENGFKAFLVQKYYPNSISDKPPVEKSQQRIKFKPYQKQNT